MKVCSCFLCVLFSTNLVFMGASDGSIHSWEQSICHGCRRGSIASVLQLNRSQVEDDGKDLNQETLESQGVARQSRQ